MPDELSPALDAPELSEVKPRFPAFQHRNFRLFWSGNLVSLVGTLAQGTAQGWLVRTLTPDEFLISLVAACSSFPMLFFTLNAGALADRIDKRRGLMVTNSLAAILALILSGLVFLGAASVWNVALIGFGLGVINAYDIPIRQSFNIEMVGRDDLPNAIALNSSAFNGARVLGPAVGGFLLRVVGMSGCFFINALSFSALILNLTRMKMAPFVPPPARQEGVSELREGLVWVVSHPVLRLITILLAVVSMFAMSFQTLLPVFAKDVFQSDERGFATLLTCNGLGALGSAFTLAMQGEMRHKGKRVLIGAFGFCLSVVAFASAPQLWLSSVCLIAAGWFLLTFLTTANTLVQTLAPDELRGRVFAIYSLALIGTSPLGALLIGALAKAIGPRSAVQLGALLAAAFVFAIYISARDLWKER